MFFAVHVCVILSIVSADSESPGTCSAHEGCHDSAGSAKVALVTGANRGIGLEVVSGLLSQLPGGSTVILTSRQEDKGRDAIKCLRERHFGEGSGATCCEGDQAGSQPCSKGSYFYGDSGVEKGNKLVYHQLDISDMNDGSIGRLHDHIKDTYGGLDILVNNGAAAARSGPETHVMVNFLGTLQLTEALFPLLRSHARVVHVGSAAGSLHGGYSEEIRSKMLHPDITMEGLMNMMVEYIGLAQQGNVQDGGWPGGSGYAVSKAALGALTRIHARDSSALAPDANGLLVNYVCPGNANAPHCQKGAHTIIQAAMLPETSHLTGRFFHDPSWSGKFSEREW